MDRDAAIGPGDRGSLPTGWWLAGLAAIAVAAGLFVWVMGLSVYDNLQQLNLVRSLLHLDLANAFKSPERHFQTSGPGFGIFALPIFAVVRPFGSDLVAYQAAGLASLVPLAWATVAASRATGVARRSVHELASVAAVVLGAPVMACYFEVLHPSDVLATAACLGAFAAVARQRTGWAFLLLGFAIVTRQWAVIAVPILAVLERGDARRHLIIGSFGTAVFVMIPFLIANVAQTIYVMSADVVSRGPLMALALLDLDRAVGYALSRYVPLIASVALSAWLWRRQVVWSPEVAVAALAVVFLVRPPLDVGGYLYYGAPGYAFFVLMGPRTWRWLVAGVVGSLLILGRYSLRRRYLIADMAAPGFVHGAIKVPGAILAVLTTSLFTAALVAALIHLVSVVRSGQGASGGPVRTEAGDRLFG